MSYIVNVLERDFGQVTDDKTGEIIRYGKVQVHDPQMRVEVYGRFGSPAYYLKADHSLAEVFSKDKVPGKFEISTVRIPKKISGKDVIEERIVAAKSLV